MICIPKMLIVDDDDCFQYLTRRVLERSGLFRIGEFAQAINGVEALQRMAQDEPPELILLDAHMPMMSGLEFLEAYAASGAAVLAPVVVLTSAVFSEDRDRVALHDNVLGMLTKPLNAEDLHAVLVG